MGFAALAIALVALNVGLQRLARPDKGNERIAGCCGMALPEELLRPEGVAAGARSAGAPAAETGTNTPGADPPHDPREKHHEL